jgi:hypothetical protein
VPRRHIEVAVEPWPLVTDCRDFFLAWVPVVTLLARLGAVVPCITVPPRCEGAPPI